jgi:hypothetical protein
MSLKNLPKNDVYRKQKDVSQHGGLQDAAGLKIYVQTSASSEIGKSRLIGWMYAS